MTSAIHGEEGRCLGEPVQLNELPAELGLHTFDGSRRRGSTGHHHAHAVAARNRTIPVRGGVEYGIHHRGRAAQHRHSVLLDTTQNLGSVDLAQHHVCSAHAGDGVHHSPTVAMELRERVQVHVAIVDSHLPAERGRVQPQVAVSQLHALGSSGRSAGVVDGGGGVFVGSPCFRLHSVSHQGIIGAIADDELVLAFDCAHGFFQFRIDEQHSCTAVLDDVFHFFGNQAEVDRHQNASRSGDTEETGEETRRVVRHHGHSLADPDSEFVETGRLGAGPFGHLTVGESAPRLGGLIGLVHHRDAIRVEKFGSTDVIDDRQRHAHGGNSTTWGHIDRQRAHRCRRHGVP